MSSPSPPPGDGAVPTDEYLSSSNGTSPPVPSDRPDRLVVLAYITAVAIPPIGFILGIVLALRPVTRNSKHWMWIIGLSIVAATAWVLLLSSGIIDTTSTDGS
jgi:hypothetical protein